MKVHLSRRLVLGIVLLLLSALLAPRQAIPAAANAVLAPPVPVTSAPPHLPTGDPAATGGQALADPLPTMIHPLWKTGLLGNGMGRSNIVVTNLDADPAVEIVLGGGVRSNANTFWSIVSRDSQGQYRQEWMSPAYEAFIANIVVADADADGSREIYVSFSTGVIHIYDAASRHLMRSITGERPNPTGMAVAPLTATGPQTLILSTIYGMEAFDPLTGTRLWRTMYGASTTGFAVGNVDADPALELVTSWFVVDSQTQTLDWDPGRDLGGFPRLGNLDADPSLELVIVTQRRTLAAYDLITHSLLWEIPTEGPGVLALEDLDGDQQPEIIFGNNEQAAIQVYDSLTQDLRWQIMIPGGTTARLGIGNTDDDAAAELIWSAGLNGTDRDHLYIADTQTHTIEWRHPDLIGPMNVVDSGDLDGDGAAELVNISAEGAIFIYDAATRVLEWEGARGLGSNTYSMRVSAVKIADVDGDQQPEILVAAGLGYAGAIYALDGRTRVMLWRSAYTNTSTYTALDSADLDGDGRPEVIGGQQRANGTTGPAALFRVLDGATGAELWQIGQGADDYGVRSLEIANIDADVALEIVLTANQRGMVYDGMTRGLEWQSPVTEGRVSLTKVLDVGGSPAPELLLVTNNDTTIRVVDPASWTRQWLVETPGGIQALRLANVDHTGPAELVISFHASLAVMDLPSRTLVAQSPFLGEGLGKGDHLVVGDLDGAGFDEFVVGTDSALIALTYRPSPLVVHATTTTSLVRPGGQLGYGITVRNHHPTTVTLDLHDALAPETVLVPGSVSAPTGTVVTSATALSWTLTLATNTQVTLRFSATVTTAVTDGMVLTNQATVWAGPASSGDTVASTVDAIAPELAILAPIPAYPVTVEQAEIHGTVRDRRSGVAQVEIRLDQGPWLRASGTYDWSYLWTTPFSDTLVRLQARATDRVGNTTLLDPIEVRVDRRGPWIVRTLPADGSLGIAVDEPVVVYFSEPIRMPQLVCLPAAGGRVMQISSDRRTVSLVMGRFAHGQTYQCLVNDVTDDSQHPLEPGPVPHPWSFTTQPLTPTATPTPTPVPPTATPTLTPVPPTATPLPTTPTPTPSVPARRLYLPLVANQRGSAALSELPERERPQWDAHAWGQAHRPR